MDDRLDVKDEVSSRRDFCAHACQALTALAFGAALPACGGGGNPAGPSPAPTLSTLAGTVNGNTVTVAVDGAGPLGSTGGAALVSAGGNALLVARVGADAFNAFSATCTHQACTINGYAAPNFQCPCHGSKFNTNGDVVQGPASRALTKYATSFAANTLTVTT